MNPELKVILQELKGDLSTTAVLWELGIIAVAVLIAWLINDALRARVMRSSPHNMKLAMGGVSRVLFPFSTLIFVWVAKLILSGYQHVGMLNLATKLLLAMAAIRLFVYAVRYIFSPGGWLKTLENLIAWSIWTLLALHLSGFLSQISQALETVQFNIGKNPVNMLLVLQALLTVIVTLFIALWLSRMLENRLMHAGQVSMNMRVVIVKLIRILLMFIATLIALSAVGLDITLLSVFGGAVGVGLGFGLQKIASNYVSGFIILLDKSMQIGDVITIENHYGVIAELRSRYLILRKLDGTEVVIPNETLITSSVINHSYSNRNARVQLPIQISYESDLELAMQLMLDEGKAHPRVMIIPAPEVQILGFGESGIDLNLNIWISDPEEGSFSLKSAIYLKIWQTFKRNKIIIPYPQREIRIIGNSSE